MLEITYMSFFFRVENSSSVIAPLLCSADSFPSSSARVVVLPIGVVELLDHHRGAHRRDTIEPIPTPNNDAFPHTNLSERRRPASLMHYRG